MPVADQVCAPAIRPGLGFDRQPCAAGDRGCAQRTRVSVRCQLARHPPGHHVREFSGGIILHSIGISPGTIEANQKADGMCDESLGKLDVDAPGKVWACQKNTARHLISHTGTGTVAGRVPHGHRLR
jgi:hypothetical protein